MNITMINIPKGTKDCLPQDSYKWQRVERVARETAALFSAKEIRTPVFEHTEVFCRGVGENTDIVNKEMYTFLDKGGRSVTLKPEGTAPIARSVCENGLANGVLPLKLYYITPCFRYERPQAGRLREFHQFGVETYGSYSAETDAETIILAHTFLTRSGVKNLKLYINSIGCAECRRNYNDALRQYLAENLGGMCELCKERYVKNPLRILDCKNDECKKICSAAPRITDYLCDGCSGHFETLKAYLDEAELEYVVNPFIVRGLDYYTRTVFEFVSESIGAQSTVCGGGRYDGLISQFGGGEMPGVGFAVGLERLLLVLDSQNACISDENVVKLFIGSVGERARLKAFGTACRLREKGIITETDLNARSVKAQLKYADKIGAEYAAVIGDDELAAGKIKIKKMSDGTQSEICISDLPSFFGADK